MKSILKSWKTTTVGIVAIIGLIYNAYLNGGFDVKEFILLVTSIGFLFVKDADQTHSKTKLSDTGGELPIEDDEESDA